MRTDRDEYKWVRDALVGQKNVPYHRPLPLKKKERKLSDLLGLVLTGVSVGFVLAAMFQ